MAFLETCLLHVSLSSTCRTEQWNSVYSSSSLSLLSSLYQTASRNQESSYTNVHHYDLSTSQLAARMGCGGERLIFLFLLLCSMWSRLRLRTNTARYIRPPQNCLCLVTRPILILPPEPKLFSVFKNSKNRSTFCLCVSLISLSGTLLRLFFKLSCVFL